MSAKKPASTAVVPAESAANGSDAVETRKGTASANPVLSLVSSPPDESRRDAASANGSAEHVPDHRSPAEIEADIEQTRDRLAGTLDELTERLSPRGLMRQANSTTRAAFVDEDGAVRKDRAAIAGGAVLALIGGCAGLLKLRRR